MENRQSSSKQSRLLKTPVSKVFPFWVVNGNDLFRTKKLMGVVVVLEREQPCGCPSKMKIPWPKRPTQCGWSVLSNHFNAQVRCHGWNTHSKLTWCLFFGIGLAVVMVIALHDLGMKCSVILCDGNNLQVNGEDFEHDKKVTRTHRNHPKLEWMWICGRQKQESERECPAFGRVSKSRSSGRMSMSQLNLFWILPSTLVNRRPCLFLFKEVLLNLFS